MLCLFTWVLWMFYISIYVVMFRWKNAACSVSLYVAITYFIMIFAIKCYHCDIETELVVRWLEVELMRVFEVLCCRCCVRTEPRLWLTAIVWIAMSCVAYSVKLNYEVFECVTCEPFPFMSLSFIMCVRVKLWKRRFFVVENKISHNY